MKEDQQTDRSTAKPRGENSVNGKRQAASPRDDKKGSHNKGAVLGEINDTAKNTRQ